MKGILSNLAGVMQDAVILVEVDGDDRRVVFANQAAEALFEYDGDALKSILPFQLLDDTRPDGTVDRLLDHLAEGGVVREPLIFKKKGGEKFWGDLQVSRMLGSSGGLYDLSVIRDISHYKSVEAQLEVAVAEMEDLEQALDDTKDAKKAADDRLLSAIQTMPDALVIWDKEDRIVVCNEAYRNVYPEIADMLVPGTRFEDILTATLKKGLVDDVGEDPEDWYAKRMLAHKQPGEPIEQKLTDGRYIRIFERITKDGDTVGCRTDVTEQRKSELKLRHYAAKLEELSAQMRTYAMHDPLTGLPNRRHLEEFLEALRDDQSDGKVGALHIDLDNFKQINDRLGHAAGDEALQFAAGALRDVIRDNDKVFRTGGDEFVMIASGDVTKELLMEIGNRIVTALSKPFTLQQQQSCRLGGSVGVAIQDINALSPAELLATSDMALFDAKRRGRGQVRAFSVDLKRRMRRKQRLADDLLAGIEAGQFFPVYQPQMDARKRHLVGVETLCRWNPPGRGVVGRDEFLPIARDLKVMHQIDQQIYTCASRDLDHLAALGLRLPRISFNLELERLLDNQLLASLRRISARGTRVAVELLESLSLDDKDTPALWAIDALRDGGVEVEIDDFGSCRASLLGVLNVRPNAIKIDRALVNSVINIRAQRDIIRALVNLANTLDIRVTAEGVESETHGDMLTSLGCHTLQGYAIARPMAVDDLEMFMKTLQDADRKERQAGRAKTKAQQTANPAPAGSQAPRSWTRTADL